MNKATSGMASTQSAVTIRQATAEDLPLILEFIRGLADYEQLLHECVADVPTLQRFLFDQRGAEVVFAEVNGAALGFALFFTTFSTFLGRPGIWLEDLFVKPEGRGQGVGRALLAHLARLTVERDYGRLEWAVLDWNQSAIDFYQSLGARPTLGWTEYRLTGDTLRAVAAGR
jgi:GNAT superfamily N-acetyltransferase